MDFLEEVLKLVDEGFQIEGYDGSMQLNDSIVSRDGVLKVLSNNTKQVFVGRKEWYQDDYYFGLKTSVCWIYNDDTLIEKIKNIKQLSNKRADVIKKIDGFIEEFDNELESFISIKKKEFKSNKINLLKEMASSEGFYDDEDWEETISWAMGE